MQNIFETINSKIPKNGELNKNAILILEAIKEINQAMTVRIKASKDLKRLTD